MCKKYKKRKQKLLPSLFSRLWTITIVMVVRLQKGKEGRLKEDHHHCNKRQSDFDRVNVSLSFADSKYEKKTITNMYKCTRHRQTLTQSKSVYVVYRKIDRLKVRLKEDHYHCNKRQSDFDRVNVSLTFADSKDEKKTITNMYKFTRHRQALT